MTGIVQWNCANKNYIANTLTQLLWFQTLAENNKWSDYSKFSDTYTRTDVLPHLLHTHIPQSSKFSNRHQQVQNRGLHGPGGHQPRSGPAKSCFKADRAKPGHVENSTCWAGPSRLAHNIVCFWDIFATVFIFKQSMHVHAWLIVRTAIFDIWMEQIKQRTQVAATREYRCPVVHNSIWGVAI